MDLPDIPHSCLVGSCGVRPSGGTTQPWTIRLSPPLKTRALRMSTVAIREFTMADYPAAFALWKDPEGISLGERDSEGGIERFLERNPDLSFVAYVTSHLVGAVLCGHDGRRGYIHQLAVARGYRRQGIGTALTLRCAIQLRACGIHKCCLSAPKENKLAKEFWERLGWTVRDDRSVLTRDVRSARGV